MTNLDIFARSIAREISPRRLAARARRIRAIAERVRWMRVIAAARVIH